MPLDVRAIASGVFQAAEIVNPAPANATIYSRQASAGAGVTQNPWGIDVVAATEQVTWQVYLHRPAQKEGKEPRQLNTGQNENVEPVFGLWVEPLVAPAAFHNVEEFVVNWNGLWGIARLSSPPLTGFGFEEGLADGSGSKVGQQIQGTFTRSPNNQQPEWVTP